MTCDSVVFLWTESINYSDKWKINKRFHVGNCFVNVVNLFLGAVCKSCHVFPRTLLSTPQKQKKTWKSSWWNFEKSNWILELSPEWQSGKKQIQKADLPAIFFTDAEPGFLRQAKGSYRQLVLVSLLSEECFDKLSVKAFEKNSTVSNRLKAKACFCVLALFHQNHNLFFKKFAKPQIQTVALNRWNTVVKQH